MDKETRNRIQRGTQGARALLEHEYAEQLEGVFDIRLDGTVAEEPGEHLDAGQRVLRAKLVMAVEHERASGMAPAEAVEAYLREAAFTTLNRFVALKMLEARELVQECISQGDQSVGFKEFTGLSPGLVQLPDHGYRLYIESLFDEIGREVRVLFDRREPASLLWPRRQALLDLLEILNDASLASVWTEDETIGWVYQYFNGDDERRRMREESQAPRNSRELAVRNQFFTPRYVVQFLTDNTLGRTWFEMMQGATELADLDYFVRPANPVFLAEGDSEPESGDDGGQETAYVRFRRKKDPRELRILDPACGSGHFLLYAFDLLSTIYEEAWADPVGVKHETSGRTLREDYPEQTLLRKAIPGLILRHNLCGIDIDARAAQIAALALWMRTQRAYREYGAPRGDRPPIRRTNIVVAEPMPSERGLRQDFVATLEDRQGQLVEHIFERMELAGEAGSLLRIETDIRRTIHKIHREHGELFRESDEERWQKAEAELRRSLGEFAAHAANGRAFQRHLFAEDAARGLGFIDVCLGRYDVVLMNPPFGAFAMRVRDWAKSEYPRTKNDMFAAFVERGIELLDERGRLGAITSRTGFFLSSFQKWREEILLREAPPIIVADLGHGVMDDAMVEAAAYCLEVAG